MRSFTLKGFFMSALLVSPILGMSTQSFFSFWLFLELSMLAFLGILSTANKAPTSVASIKYFLMQALSSTVFLGASLLCFSHTTQYFQALLIGVFLWKLGAIPFHFWYVSIVNSLSWDTFFLLSTVQKILPIWALANLNFNFLTALVFLICLVSAYAAFSQHFLKKLLAFSSLFNMAWVFASLNSMVHCLGFLLFYSLSLFWVTLELHSSKFENISDMSKALSPSSRLTMIFSLLNMCGIPPFMMFIPKLMLLLLLLNFKMPAIALVLVFTSVLFVFIYLRIFIKMLTLESFALLTSSIKQTWLTYSSLLFLLFFSLMFLGLA